MLGSILFLEEAGFFSNLPSLVYRRFLSLHFASYLCSLPSLLVAVCKYIVLHINPRQVQFCITMKRLFVLYESDALNADM